MKLEIKNLYAGVEGKEILKGLNLVINPGEIHTIMGPNGTGKSTLNAVIMGHPKYVITSGDILVNDVSILNLTVDERARLGLYLSMQYPSEISGITNSDFIRNALKANGKEIPSLFRYVKQLEGYMEELHMDKAMAHRYLNVGFSGGEKKKNEIVQLEMLKPELALLDEIDSGLDVDALNVVGSALQKMATENSEISMLLITHYQRLLDYINPTHVHVMLEGQIVESGDFSIVKVIEKDGYQVYRDKYNLSETLEEVTRIKVGSCAVHEGVK